MKRKSLLITSIVFLILLAIGGAVWYGKTKETFKEGQNQAVESNSGGRDRAAKEGSQEVVIDTSDWKEYQAKDLGISFKLPRGWSFDEKEFSILSQEKKQTFGVSVFAWPDFLGEVGKDVSIKQVLTDRSYGFIDRYHFSTLSGSLSDMHAPVGRGVTFLRENRVFRSDNQPSELATERNYLLFSEQKNKTYSFVYSYFQDSYDASLNNILEAIIQTARPLP